ncbi:MAG: tetratricopeptide repeat protein [Opitutaceae bacterium]|nr:tetratricopeptide repeat protein [Opitutaceae bacterium]
MLRWSGRILIAYLSVWAAVLLFTPSCRRADTNEAAAQPMTVTQAVTQTSESCRTCHDGIHAAWAPTDHALANRATGHSPEIAEALKTFPVAADKAEVEACEMILGHLPLWQPLVKRDGGRYQPHEFAYDPKAKEWFNVFGNEQRRPGEWGHWTGRGMNWNSMCAHCHMTGFRKGYDEPGDRYHSTWVEQGVSCIQCHGAMPADHGRGAAKPAAPASAESPAKTAERRIQEMHTCAPCHARNEPLTSSFQPGDSYFDHFRVELPLRRGVFFPDGQQQDEVFNWTSVLLSRMGHAGVTCMDCHDPHTSKTVLPVSNNALCMQCHAAPGRVMVGGIHAVPIDPVAHSHHGAGSAGNQCVSCHMPTTNYMQRAPRHDHGWLKPDPLMTQELGIPNACSRCHADKPVSWAIEKTDAWYGEKMDSLQRRRARAVDAAQKADARAASALLALLKEEQIPAWRATYIGLLAEVTAPSAEVFAAAEAALAAADPLERSAAVRLLASHDAYLPRLRPLLKDPVRLVRLDAAWALSRELTAGSPERAELDAMLNLTIDQPAGRARWAQDLANRGHLPEADRELALAEKWDPFSPGLKESHGFVLNAMGRSAEAAALFYRAAQLDPSASDPAFRAGLAYAEAGRIAEAETSLRLAVQRDPALHRAWYNLGLLLAGQERLPDAADALKHAESLAPSEPDYPYALATVLLRQGDAAGAAAAANRALEIDPGNAGARQLLQQIR